MAGNASKKQENSASTGQIEAPQSADISSPELLVPHRTAPALMMSFLFHVVLLTLIGLIWSRDPRGTGEALDRPIGIALVHRMPDRDQYVDAMQLAQPESETQSQEAQASTQAAASAAPPAELTPPIDLTGILNAMEATPAPVSGSGLAGETNLSGDAFGGDRGKNSPSTGSDATTMVFGVSGSGSRVRLCL